MAQASLSRAGVAMFAHAGDLLSAMRALARAD
jgi:hypothetical protein